ncbi:MAG: DUF2513 domain-containing protein [Chloroflexi bacterium]|nr:DUF2513 domain-containing protein [Chloroflexota bacterium]MYK60782.1 DUF2513 domain-containing protein [Chloroflexota bacterium]
MKRDMKVVREVLEAVEKEGGPFGGVFYNKDLADKYYHAEMLVASGFVTKNDQGLYAMLTMEGHDLLEQLRDDDPRPGDPRKSNALPN